MIYPKIRFIKNRKFDLHYQWRSTNNGFIMGTSSFKRWICFYLKNVKKLSRLERGVRRLVLSLRTRTTEAVYWYCHRPWERLRLRLVYLLPRSLVYWCAIRLIAHATIGKHGAQLVSELTAMDALDRWRHDA